MPSTNRGGVPSYSLPPSLAAEIQEEMKHEDSITSEDVMKNVAKNNYNKQRYNRIIDFNLESNKSYKDIMLERNLEREEARVHKEIEDKEKEEIAPRKRKKRWDVTPEEYEQGKSLVLRETFEVPASRVPVIQGLPLTDEILDKILPAGYVKVDPPVGFEQNVGVPDVTEAPKEMFYMPPDSKDHKQQLEQQVGPSDIPGVEGLQFFKPEDMKFFGSLVKVKDEELMLTKQRNEVMSLRLILKIKNGIPLVRKRSLRQITDNAIKIGSTTLFSQILPMLMEPGLQDHEQHILIKLIGRIIFPLGGEQIKPYTYKILAVVAPLLIDEEFTLRMEAREIVANLASLVGLANIISSMRPDIDHVDEYVRNITSRVFAIVAYTLGLQQVMPFLRAVIKSKKNWMARHTGIKIIQQLCILLGSGGGTTILPHLSQLVAIIVPGLNDEILQVRIIAGLTLSQLADNVSPHGMESFEQVLEPVWYGIKKHRGRALASYLKCIGSIVPLMTYDRNYEEYSNYYSRELVGVITREFNSPDEDMRKTILKILIGLPINAKLVRNYATVLMEPFFKAFWNRRTASDAVPIVRLVEDATALLGLKFEFLHTLETVVIFTKNGNEPLRKMAIEAINKLLSSSPDGMIGSSPELETRLVDGILYAFQEQTRESKVYLQVFASAARALGTRLRPHISPVISSALFRLKNQAPETRQQSADLITILAPAIKQCSEDNDEILMKLILILYESLGEIYPEVLGSIISALHACIDNLERSRLYTLDNPSINQILPTLTPILKNRQEKVQEACIKLIGLIARKNGESINAKEWMRICFELLEMLKSTKKRIRIVANDTFGAIAKTIGPQDIIVMLLNNLRVQERQLRVCTAVAVGIVAETCAPFTVLPAIMNEYRTPEKNVQNGVLKSLSFLFEYIDGNVAKQYMYAITPMIEDALMDRDLVHRQTAATVVKHICLNSFGVMDSEKLQVFVHFLNLLMPNIFETSPHVIERILESIDAIRISIGVGTFANYLWAGLFHPARKVRTPYWKMYNNIYVQARDTLVPHYPRIEKLPDSDVDYNVDAMDIIL